MKKGRLLPIGLSLAVSLAVVFLHASYLYAKQLSDGEKKIKAFVSILPQAYFVERVGGERVDVSVMVGPGQSPATYEPRPKQMAELGKARLYFRIGVPFENVWMGRISKANPDLKMIDTRCGIKLLSMKSYQHGNDQAQRHHTKEVKDPHIWLSLRLVKIQATNICQALIAEDPSRKGYFEANLRAFLDDLDKLDKEMTEKLRRLSMRKFMVFHPAWAYFARDYGLDQIPVEIEGKQPSAKVLASSIEQAKKEGIKVIFVQKQFSKKSAAAVARAISGRVIQVDPLASDYMTNMRTIAETFAKVML